MAVTVSIGGNARIDYVAANSLRIRTTADGAQGVLDVTLINPPTIPAVEDAIVLVDGSTTVYDGKVRVVKLRQIKSNVFVDLSAQDDAVYVLPSAAPFNLSDTPNNSTTFGWKTLTLQSENINGSIKMTGVATIFQPGLVAGHAVLVTSANYGLTAQEFTIQQIDTTYEKETAPVFTLYFGDPLVRLANVVRSIPDGYITTTMIADDAISTPKLQANAVKTFSNEGATVTIDENGITIEDGYLNFPFPGGENVLRNSGFELGDFVAASSTYLWTSSTEWTASAVRTRTNITEGTSLTLTGSTY